MRVFRIFLIFCSVLILVGCAPRRRAISPGEIPHWSASSREDGVYGEQVLNQLSRHFPPSRDFHDIQQTDRVVARLAQAAGSPAGAWRVFLFAEDQVKNAAATRGNYIFIWSGLLRAVRGDDELATIVAHEMAHVLAQHVMPNPAEQISEAMASVGGAAASQVIAGGSGAASMAAQLLTALPRLWHDHQPLLLPALVGVEASGWLHLIQDGDPIPRLPRPLRWLRRRGRQQARRRGSR
jgi:predicted Zn-dependent protease